MEDSTQHKLTRTRPPRVQITYDVEVGHAVEAKELPFLMGIMADLGGHPKKAQPKLKDRKFIEINRDTFNDVMAAIAPCLAIKVANKASSGKSSQSIVLNFSQMDDFNPVRILHQVPNLLKLYEARMRLNDLIAKLDGNEDLDDQLRLLMADGKAMAPLKKDLLAARGGAKVNEFLKKGKIARDASQQEMAIEMLAEFVKQLNMHGKSGSDNPVSLINQCIEKIDGALSAQLNEILHHKAFRKLEGSWRGLHYLVTRSQTGRLLRLRLLNISKAEMIRDLDRAVEFDQSELFKKIYEEEYGTFGGTPYSCLLGDFEFGRHPMDMMLLEKMSRIAAAAHAPFIASASPKLFDMEGFSDLSMPHDLTKIFKSTSMEKWQSFRQSEDSRYVSLVVPHILMRLPYGPKTRPLAEFNFEEKVNGETNTSFCWGNAAYALGARITNAVALYSWTAAIRGVEGGGLVEDLPTYTFKSTDGDIALKCPTEIAITDRREKELSDLGFISLCHSKNTDFAAFFGVQTTQEPKIYNKDDASASARLSTQLTYVMAASRFAHYIKVIMRDKVGSFMNRQDVSRYLNTWIAQYVLISDKAAQTTKSRFPLREARVDVSDVPGKPGCYTAVVYLRPHFQLEELSASIRLVAQLPQPVR